MKNALRTVVLGGVVACLIATTTFTVAQDRGGRGGRGGFDPSQFRERMLEQMQEQLEFSDEEWKAVSPLVQDVMEKQQDNFRGGFRFFGGRGPGGDRGGRGRGGFGEPDPATEALMDVLENEDASADSIQAKLTVLRDARKKQEKELQAAREKLRKVLNLRQEAQLVLFGMLD